MSKLTDEDMEAAREYDVSQKMHINDCINATLRAKTETQLQIQEDVCVSVAVGDILNPLPRSDHDTVITDDTHDTYVKILAYAGPPPNENMLRGVNNFSRYIPWVRQVALGIRMLFPSMKQKQVYEKTMLYADWCRQQRRK